VADDEAARGRGPTPTEVLGRRRHLAAVLGLVTLEQRRRKAMSGGADLAARLSEISVSRTRPSSGGQMRVYHPEK
jgi:hypothetical protein